MTPRNSRPKPLSSFTPPRRAGRTYTPIWDDEFAQRWNELHKDEEPTTPDEGERPEPEEGGQR